jgi:hypothetical protein
MMWTLPFFAAMYSRTGLAWYRPLYALRPKRCGSRAWFGQVPHSVGQA